MKNYDAIQMGATLTQCWICKKFWWITKPSTICISCDRPFIYARQAEQAKS